jgi:GNAT superfamily N-acetyltransferase
MHGCRRASTAGGHGSRLLREAEAFALARGCRNAYVDTFDHQARPFYERHGNALFGTLEGYPPGSRQHFLRKDLG